MRSLLREYVDAYRGFDREATAYLLAVLLGAVGGGARALLRNLFLKEIGYGEDAIGWLQSAAGLGQVLVALPAIYLMARIGYRRTLRGLYAVEGAASLAQALAPVAAVFAAGGLFGGAMGALYQAVAAPFLMGRAEARSRTHLFGLSFAVVMAGQALGATLGGAAQELAARALGSSLLGYRVAIGLAAVPQLLALVPLRRLADDRPAVPVAGVLASLRLARPARVAALAAPEVLIGFGAGLTIPFLQIYFRNTFGQGSLAIGTIYAFQSAAMMAGYLTVPVVARRLGLATTVVLTQALSIPFFLELAYPHGLGLAILAFCLRAMFMNMGSPAFSQLAQEVVDPSDRRAVQSIVMLARNGAWMVANVVGGSLIAGAGGTFGTTIALTAGLYVLACSLGAGIYPVLLRTVPHPPAEAVETSPAPGPAARLQVSPKEKATSC